MESRPNTERNKKYKMLMHHHQDPLRVGMIKIKDTGRSLMMLAKSLVEVGEEAVVEEAEVMLKSGVKKKRSKRLEEVIEMISQLGEEEATSPEVVEKT